MALIKYQSTTSSEASNGSRSSLNGGLYEPKMGERDGVYLFEYIFLTPTCCAKC